MPPKAERKPRQSKKQTTQEVKVEEPIIKNEVEEQPIINNEVVDEMISDDEDEPQNEIIETKEEAEEQNENEEEDDDDLTEEEKEMLRQAEQIKNKMRLKQEQKDYEKFKKLQGEGILKEEFKRQIDLITQFVEQYNIYDCVINLYNERSEDYVFDTMFKTMYGDEIQIDRYLKPLYNKMIEPQTIKAVKKEKPQKEDGEKKKRVSTDKDRPKGKEITECFKRDTLLHHNKAGYNEYAVIYAVSGKVQRCNKEMKELSDIYETINEFCVENIRRKTNNYDPKKRPTIQYYINVVYKNDAGIWCSCDEVKRGRTLTQNK